MKVIYFSTNYTPHDYRFLKAIVDGGHEAYFVQLESNARQIEDRPVPLQVMQVHWKGGREPFRWGKLPALVLDFKRLLRDLEPDLVHAGPIQTCALIAVLSGFRPVLTMSWGFDLMDDVHRGKWWKWATKYVMRKTQFFTSDAMVTRDKAIAHGMNPERTIVIPWGVDLDRFKPNPDHWSLVTDRFTLFCNRSWETRYGVDVLVRAFVKVAQQKDNVDLILLSGGSQAANIRRILQNGGVLERVTFGGQISQTDLPRWYHMADLYISPSHVDGSSVSLMEALACGLPCLVSDIPGNKEWVEDGVNGWLFRDGEADDLAEKILLAIKKRREFKRIGELARKTAEERADWRKNFGKLLDTYHVIARSERQ